jgi:hypothetical protein
MARKFLCRPAAPNSGARREGMKQIMDRSRAILYDNFDRGSTSWNRYHGYVGWPGFRA